MSQRSVKLYNILSVFIFVTVCKCIESYSTEEKPRINIKEENRRITYLMSHLQNFKLKSYMNSISPELKKVKRQIFTSFTVHPKRNYYSTQTISYKVPRIGIFPSNSNFNKLGHTYPTGYTSNLIKVIPIINNYNKIQVTPISDNHNMSSSQKQNILSSKTDNITNIEYETSEIDDDLSNKTQIDENIIDKYVNSLDCLERRFYSVTFNKLSANAPIEKRENGISFVQSGLFLHLALTALTGTVDHEAQREIYTVTHFNTTEEEKADAIKYVMSMLPESDEDLKFRKSYRLILTPGVTVTDKFQNRLAKELNMKIDYYNGSTDATSMADALNNMVLIDSEGALHDTFDDTDISPKACGVLLSVLYLRGRWRSAPTLLNGLHPFYDATDTHQTVRMIRINDVINYADLTDWNAQAVEIKYATEGLRLMLVVPRGRSLRAVAERMAALGAEHVLARMVPRRLAITMPLYTLRMTLLLPNKLRELGMNMLVDNPDDENRSPHCQKFALSQAVQRIMFWSEAGRHAFKDDGIEWDEHPDMELVVNRPYAFFVRWHNVTLMNGHFVL